jgi:hypothetical protein
MSTGSWTLTPVSVIQHSNVQGGQYRGLAIRDPFVDASSCGDSAARYDSVENVTSPIDKDSNHPSF